MSETNLIEVEMHGIKVKGTVSQIAELKKLLDEQNSVKYKFPSQVQSYPNYQYPYVDSKQIVYNPNTVYCGTLSGTSLAIGGVATHNNQSNSTLSSFNDCGTKTIHVILN